MVALLALGACGDELTLPQPLSRPEIRAITFDTTSQIGDLTVELTRPAAVDLEYWTDFTRRLRVTSPPDMTHRLRLARLVPAASYTYEIWVTDRDGRRRAFADTFVSDTLPTDLAAVKFTTTGDLSAPLVMLELRPPTFQGFAAIDAKGRVVWHHRTGGASWGWTRRTNGNFVFLDTQDGLTEVTVDGRSVARRPSLSNGRVIHHDVIATPEETVLFMVRDRRMVESVTWTGETIFEWNPDTDDLVERWTAFDFLDPRVDVGPRTRQRDWLHANSIALGPAGDVIMSLRALDQIISIAADYQTINWRLGGPNGDFTIAPDGVFSGQHTAVQLESGNLVMFDNRQVPPDGEEYSRALELDMDFDAGHATKAWDFRPPNDNFSPIISSARRLPNGNTLVAFGTGSGIRDAVGPIEVYEVTSSGDVVWHLEIEGPELVYRATPLDHIADEVVVR